MDDMCSGIAAVYQWVLAHGNWESIKEFGNSTFFTSLSGALAGAWAGGRIAQVLASKAKDKEDLTKDIRNSNAAATMASALCDDLAGLMGQHVKELKDTYDADRARFEAALVAAATTDRPHLFTANLQYLNTPPLSTEVLQSLIYGQVSNNFAIKVFSSLNQAIANVKSTNAYRNTLIDEFRTMHSNPAALRFSYFGQPHDIAGTDDRYRAALSNIYSSLQDGIYLSMHLSLLLCEHSAKLGMRYKNEYGRPVPKAQKVDFTRLADRGLLPDRKNYPDWDQMFYPPTEPTRWQSLKQRISGEHTKN
jgi:hypothetical protein